MGEKNRPLKRELFPIEWSPTSMKAMRMSLKLTQQDAADYLNVSKGTITRIEQGRNSNPMLDICYALFLERYYAWTKGCVPGYRKVGMNDFIKMRMM